MECRGQTPSRRQAQPLKGIGDPDEAGRLPAALDERTVGCLVEQTDDARRAREIEGARQTITGGKRGRDVLEALARPIRRKPGCRGLRRIDAKITAHVLAVRPARSEEHTSELQSLMRNSYAVF